MSELKPYLEKNSTKVKGFTLVEIMIVVVIIGLLAALAVPAFSRARADSQRVGIINDGRQLGLAAQQYYIENGRESVFVSIATSSGNIGGGLTSYLRQITPDTTFAGALEEGETFSLTRGPFVLEFDSGGILVD